MSGKSCEQQARDLLEQCGVEDAQSFTAGDVVALANFINDAHAHRAVADEIEQQVLPALADAIVAAEVHGDYGPHVMVQDQLRDIARRLRLT